MLPSCAYFRLNLRSEEMAKYLTDKVTMSKTWDAYINTTVLCGQEGFVVWAEDGDLGHCFQDLVLHIPAQVGVSVLVVS